MKLYFLLVFAFIAPALASLQLSEDIVGEGSLWTSTDGSLGHDRAGGQGEWAYGHIVAPGYLTSMYSFDGAGGWYSVAYKEANLTQFIQASDLSSFNASTQLAGNESTIDLSGSGRLKAVTLTPDVKGHPADLSRTYISGSFTINRSVKAW